MPRLTVKQAPWTHTRHYCWHCGERVIGKLTTWTTRPHCSACPSWQTGCIKSDCQDCLTATELAQAAKFQPQRDERRKRRDVAKAP